MKKVLVILLAACAGALAQTQTAPPVPPAAPKAAPPAATAAPRAAGPTKLATIHIQNAIVGTKEGQQAADALQTKFNPRKQALEKLQSDINALQQQMRAGAATMTPEAKDKLTRDIDAKSTQLKRDNEDFQADLQQEEGKLMNDLGQKIMAIIGNYANQHGITMVIDVSNPQSPVLWVDSSIDITTEIVKQYDQAHPAAASAPAPATRPPAAPVTKK